jgi:GxxExxY protein
MNSGKLELNEITERVLGCAYQVSNTLGIGFLEKVYENALVYELRKRGLKAEQQYGIPVHYDGVVVGEYVADVMVNDSVLVELKAVKALDSTHVAQCLNYIKATRLPVCLLLNFGSPRIEVKRIAY